MRKQVSYLDALLQADPEFYRRQRSTLAYRFDREGVTRTFYENPATRGPYAPEPDSDFLQDDQGRALTFSDGTRISHS